MILYLPLEIRELNITVIPMQVSYRGVISYRHLSFSNMKLPIISQMLRRFSDLGIIVVCEILMLTIPSTFTDEVIGNAIVFENLSN